jgi:hypothetical protein
MASPSDAMFAQPVSALVNNARIESAALAGWFAK